MDEDVKENDTYDLEIKLTKTGTKKGVTLMKVSKIKVIAKYLTGGLASVVEYLLDLFNELIQKLPKEDVAKYAQLAKDVANFVSNCCVLITDEKKKAAAQLTAQAFGDLATALLDSNMTKDELDGIVEAAKKAIEAWKEA